MDIQFTTFNESGLNAGVVIQAGQAFVDRLANSVGAPSQEVSGQKDPTAAEKEQREIARLRSKGQEYIENELHWKFLMASYEGGRNYSSETNLFKHQREHRRDYDDRLKRAHYTNYCQPLVDFVPEYIFSQGVERQPNASLAAQFELFKKDCDRAGTSLDSFMQSRGEDIRIFGMTYIQVDKLPLPVGEDPKAVSVQRAADLGVNAPYLIAINPIEVLKWNTDSRGNYLYLKRVEYIHQVDDEGNTKPIERYTEWTPMFHRVSTIDASDPRNPHMAMWGEPKPNQFGKVPFIAAFYKRLKSNKDVGQSFLQDIAYQNRHVFNLTSLLDEFLYRQCFNMLVMPMRSQVPTKEQVEGDIGTNNVLEVPESSQHKPEYLSPPVGPAKFIQEERKLTVQEMYRTAAQDIMSELGLSGSQRSAEAQKQQFSRTIPVINKTADTLEFAERKIMALWAEFQAEEWTGKISYKDDYSITNLLDLLLQLGMIFNTVKLQSPTFVREEWKRVVREFDSKLQTDVMEKIINEIDSLDDAQIVMMLQAASQDVKASVSVPSTSNMMQGTVQDQLGSDNRIAAATGSKANTKERAPDKNKRAKTGT